MKGVLSENYELFVAESGSALRPTPKKIYLRSSIGGTMGLREIASLVLILLQEKEALWLLSEEGENAQKQALKTDLFICSTNPTFPSEAARQKAEELFNPFSEVIKILEMNSYSVTKK